MCTPLPLHHVDSPPFVKEQMEVGRDTIRCPHNARQQDPPHDAQSGPWRIRGMASRRTTADGAQALNACSPYTLPNCSPPPPRPFSKGCKLLSPRELEKIPKGHITLVLDIQKPNSLSLQTIYPSLTRAFRDCSWPCGQLSLRTSQKNQADVQAASACLPGTGLPQG